MHLVRIRRRDQSTYVNTISFSLVHDLCDYTGFEPAKSFILSFPHAQVLVSR